MIYHVVYPFIYSFICLYSVDIYAGYTLCWYDITCVLSVPHCTPGVLPLLIPSLVVTETDVLSIDTSTETDWQNISKDWNQNANEAKLQSQQNWRCELVIQFVNQKSPKDRRKDIKMGSFLGHVLPGLYFLVLGAWGSFNCSRNFSISRWGKPIFCQNIFNLNLNCEISNLKEQTSSSIHHEDYPAHQEIWGRLQKQGDPPGQP